MHKEITLNEAFKDFILDGRIRNLSERTEEFYQFTWDCFRKEMPQVKTMNQINLKVFNQYVLKLRKMDIAPVTVNNRMRGVRTFFNYLINNGYIEPFKITIKKAQKPLKETYSDEELQILLEKPTKPELDNSFALYRDWVIVNYLISTGNRASTIVNLKVKDVDLASGYVKLNHTKNKKQQIIPLPDQTVKILNEYIRHFNPKNDMWLFPSIYGTRLTVNGLSNNIAKYNKKRGIEKRGVHLFRHTFAKMWIMNGGDIFTLKNMMGHSSIEILQEYVQLYSNENKINNDKYNPMNNLSVPTRTRMKIK